MLNLGWRKCTLLGTSVALLVILAGGWGCSNNSSTPDIAASTNTAPVINSVTASPNVVTRGGTSEITVSAIDAEDDELVYTYTPSGGTITGGGSSATWKAPAEPGKYTITVTISDGRTTTEAWVSLTVFVPMTTIAGTLVLPTGATGNLVDTRMILRAGATDVSSDQLVRYIPTSGSGSRVIFVIDDVIPGTYYLEAWQDTDHNGLISNGDFYGRYGGAGEPGDVLPPLELSEGQTRFVYIQMALIPVIGDDDTQDEYTAEDDQTIKDGSGTTTERADR